MLLATDTHYEAEVSRTAGVLFSSWTDAEPTDTRVIEAPAAADYESGSFYLRELPCVLALLETVDTRPEVIVIDGYVHLDGEGRKGLGAHLHGELGGEIAIVGVAKNSFAGSAHASQVLRGDSDRPLFVTAAGMPLEEAAAHIRSMHGPFRHPTLLKLADGLCRGQ